jgi:hypothetical protein
VMQLYGHAQRKLEKYPMRKRLNELYYYYSSSNYYHNYNYNY